MENFTFSTPCNMKNPDNQGIIRVFRTQSRTTNMGFYYFCLILIVIDNQSLIILIFITQK